MRRLPAVIAAVLGLASGFACTRYLAFAPDVPMPGEASATATSAPEAPAPRSDAATRQPRSVRVAGSEPHPLAARAAALAAPALPPTKDGWSPLLDDLRRRAERGDAAAASEWLQRDARCFAMMPAMVEAGANVPTPAFMRIAARRRSRMPSLDPGVAAALALEDDEQRRLALGQAQQRLGDECRGYVPEPPQVRYALAEIAARLGSDKDFWRFINEPPFAPGYSRDIEQAVDWARRAPGMVYERALRGDADAAYALGIAYAIDHAREIDGGTPSRMLPAAIGNDPLQAYRWLSVYLRGNPDAETAATARALLNRVGAGLTPEQRGEAERWVP